MLAKLHTLLLLFILINFASQAADVVLIKNISNQPLQLTNQAMYFEDIQKEYSLNSIINLNNEFYLSLKNFYPKSTQSAIWVKLELCNQSLNNRFIVNLADWKSADSIDIFIILKNGITISKKSGYFRKASELDYPFNNAVSKTGAYLPMGDTITIYARYITYSGFGSKPQLSIEHEFNVLKKNRHDGLLQGIFQGIIWLIAIFSLSFFIFLRERIYLYYFFYIAIFSFYFFAQDGFLFEIILPNHPSTANFIYAISSVLSPTFFLLFTRGLIINKPNLTFWQKGHFILIIVFAVITLSVFFALLFNSIKIAFILVNFAIMLSTIYMIPFIIGLSRIKDHEVLYVLLASASVLLFSVLGVISLQFNINFGGFSSYQLMKVGVTIELLLFNSAIAYRLYTNELEKRLSNEKLIEQLKINEKIKDEMNQELEGLVLLRTQELENQNAEIMAQRDDIYYKNQMLEDQNHEILAQKETIEYNHKLLTDSLNYARIIQNAIIPPPEHIAEAFNDYFLLSKPKDVVSGDFYWVKHQNSQSMIAIADCTGHGVPGAMLSILGVTGLNKIVHNTTEMRPDTTLEILRKDIITSLRQENDLIAKEGMDMAICLIDASTHKLEFAGAHQPGLIIRKGELIKLESSAQPIGRYLKETPFKQYSFELQNDDMIYLFTDGYFDQLGGEFTKKFMSRQFKEILIDIHKLACSEQLIHLKKVLNQWQGTNEQTDDITILGIRYQTN